VWSHGAVWDAPAFNQDYRFFQGIEDLTVEQLVSELAVEFLVVAILLW
jgi:hypothetical protein